MADVQPPEPAAEAMAPRTLLETVQRSSGDPITTARRTSIQRSDGVTSLRFEVTRTEPCHRVEIWSDGVERYADEEPCSTGPVMGAHFDLATPSEPTRVIASGTTDETGAVSIALSDAEIMSADLTLAVRISGQRIGTLNVETVQRRVRAAQVADEEVASGRCNPENRRRLGQALDRAMVFLNSDNFDLRHVSHQMLVATPDGVRYDLRGVGERMHIFVASTADVDLTVIDASGYEVDTASQYLVLFFGNGGFHASGVQLQSSFGDNIEVEVKGGGCAVVLVGGAY